MRAPEGLENVRAKESPWGWAQVGGRGEQTQFIPQSRCLPGTSHWTQGPCGVGLLTPISQVQDSCDGGRLAQSRPEQQEAGPSLEPGVGGWLHPKPSSL